MFRKFLLLILFFLPLAISNAQISSPSVTMSPTKGAIGDTVTFIGTFLPDYHFEVLFKSAQSISVSEVKTVSNTNAVTFNVLVPPGTVTGEVKLVWEKPTHQEVSAGTFTLLEIIKKSSNDPGQSGIGLRPGPNQYPTGPSSGSPSGQTLANIDREVDLPVSRFGTLDPVVQKNTPPPPPPPAPPEIPLPTLYGKDLKSENGTIFYVIDVSGSMSWDMGQYAGLDGSIQNGCRLDRAKVELIKSILSLPKSFKFNIDSYDCSYYAWQTMLVPADDSHKKLAIEWINNLQPQGATNTGGAMAAALQFKNCKLFVLLTDGQPTCTNPNIPTHLQQINSNNTQRATINTYGIGATGDFKQFCIDIASQNGGSYTDVR